MDNGDLKPSKNSIPNEAKKGIMKPSYYPATSERKVPYKYSKKNKIFTNKCAFENDRKFLAKIADGKKAMKKLFFVSCICFLFMGCEFAGGIISNSLAILTDAAHMFSDVAGFMISFFSIFIS